MRHTFVVHVVADIGDTDPQDLMGPIDEVIAEAFDTEAVTGSVPLRDIDVECIDAYELGGVAV